jgi:hypothetical protein
MKIYISVSAMLFSIAAFAQTITYTTVDISDPEEQDWKSSYPIFTSTTKPKAAEAINMALQMADFGKCNTKKNPLAIKPVEQPYAWKFTVTRPADKLIEVTTIRTTVQFGMQSAPYDDVFVYHFDAETGDRIYPYNFFYPVGFMTARTNALPALLNRIKTRKDELIKEHSEVDPSELFDENYVNDCFNEVKKEWDNGTVRLNIKKDAIVFLVDDCGNNIPRRPHELYSSEVPVSKIQSSLSPVFNYYVNNGPKPGIKDIDHIWRGTIGTNIPVTIMLQTVPGRVVRGLEVYDSHGGALGVSGSFKDDGWWLDEFDGGKTVGTFFFKMTNSELTGTWKKADGSRTLPFKAILTK